MSREEAPLMPLYEYRCPDGHVTEAQRPLHEAAEPKQCGHVRKHAPGDASVCGLQAERILSPPAPFFPGAGRWRGAA